MTIIWDSPNSPQRIFSAAISLANAKIAHADELFQATKKPLMAAMPVEAPARYSPAVDEDVIKAVAKLFEGWGLLMPEGALGAMTSLVAQAEEFMRFFFGDLSAYQAKVDKLLDLVSSPASALQSIGNRNVARMGMDGVFAAEVARYQAHTAELANYELPPGAASALSSQASQRAGKLRGVAGVAMERKFLDFDRGANDDMISVRLDAARTLLGEPGAAFASIKDFIEGAALSIFTRSTQATELRMELAQKLGKLYVQQLSDESRAKLHKQQFLNESKEIDLENWKANAGMAEADHTRMVNAFAACSENIVLQLSAILNMMAASSSFGSGYTQNIKIA